MPKNSEKRKILLLYSAQLEGNGVTKIHTCSALAFGRLHACLRRRVKGPGNGLKPVQTTKNTIRQQGKSILFKNILFFLSLTKNRLHPIQAFVNNRL